MLSLPPPRQGQSGQGGQGAHQRPRQHVAGVVDPHIQPGQSHAHGADHCGDPGPPGRAGPRPGQTGGEGAAGVPKQFNIGKLKRIVTGGKTGQESIYNALSAITEDHKETANIIVMIHDGNRPMVSQDIITDNIVKQKINGSAVAVIPTSEVVFVSKDGFKSKEALKREDLWRTQTPHSYKFDELWSIHQRAINDGITNTAASCSLMQHYGYTTYFSKGSEKNIKITTVEDIEIFKALLNAKNDAWIKK